MTTYIMNEIKVNEHILDDDKYLLIFSVEEVNRLAREGMPFRDAYKKVGLDIEAGNFSQAKRCIIPMKAVSETFATMKSLP